MSALPRSPPGSAASPWGPVAAHGLISLTGLLLTGVVAFLLVRSLTGSAAAGPVAGVPLGVIPHNRFLARSAQAYTHLWRYLFAAVGVHRPRAPPEPQARPARRRLHPARHVWTPYFTLYVLVEVLGAGWRRWP